MKERNGSSRQAIAKYIKANYKVGDSADVHVKMALKRGVASGALQKEQVLGIFQGRQEGTTGEKAKGKET